VHLPRRGWRVSSTVVLLIAIIFSLTSCVVPRPNQPPVAMLQATPTNGRAPLTVTFDISASYDPDGKIVSFTLIFGDGDSTTGSDVTKLISHTYGDNGSYTATLAVIDDDGSTGQATTTIMVSNPGPTASFTYFPQNPKSNETITFDASGSVDPASVEVMAQSIVDYAWDFGDGNMGSGVIVTHSYARAGSYTVILTVTDDDGAVNTAATDLEVLWPLATSPWPMFRHDPQHTGRTPYIGPQSPSVKWTVWEVSQGNDIASSASIGRRELSRSHASGTAR